MGREERQQRREDRRDERLKNLHEGAFRLDTNGNLFDHDKIGEEQKVEGLYWTSKTTRDNIMKHIWDRHGMLPDTLTYSMSKLMDAISIAEHSPKNMTSLYEYTHNGKTGFSQSISDKYLNAGKRENRLISIGSDYAPFIPWHEKYGMEPTSKIDDRKIALKSARRLKKEGKLQSGDFALYKNEEDKSKGGYSLKELRKDAKNTKDARKKIRKEYRQKRNELEKDGIWTNNTDRDATYNDYGKLNRSASWINDNIGDGKTNETIGKFITDKYLANSSNGSSNDLSTWSVLNRRNGLVDIIAKQRHHSDKFSQKELKKCMFSITNLATRDDNNKMGTVMWFPPYDLNFQESISVQWDEKQFIGRGEPIYSYVNTVRNGTLSFTLLIDHPSILNDIARQKVEGEKTNDGIERDILNFFSGTGESIKIDTKNNPNIDKPFIVNEYTYFEKLEENNKFVFDKIKEKVKYFHPAYHSMTPEGFNMRLNFLHQCTRQGPTEGTNGVANNSVFGRPPFCELRIGDFINTRIAINSLSITYDNGGGMTWDLNPEGIGVQPMMAKIQLGIYIIGGQSLSGPVLELCNAVSHNFYANTGVYASSSDERRRSNIDNNFDKLSMHGSIFDDFSVYGSLNKDGEIKRIQNEINNCETQIAANERILNRDIHKDYCGKAEGKWVLAKNDDGSREYIKCRDLIKEINDKNDEKSNLQEQLTLLNGDEYWKYEKK